MNYIDAVNRLFEKTASCAIADWGGGTLIMTIHRGIIKYELHAGNKIKMYNCTMAAYVNLEWETKKYART
jgi:hypothetical protein